MKKIKIILLIFIILINSIFTVGCWSYREVDDLTIVSGVAIDKGTKNQYQMTVEIVHINGGTDKKMTSKTISTEGKTMFDAARNMIALAGKKLYWGHTKLIILSKDVASEGVAKAIEWYNRDYETRDEVHMLISQRPTAREIFNEPGITDEIKSFALDKMIINQSNLSKAPITNVLKFDIESKTKGISPVIPAVNLKQIDGRMTPEVMGTAIIKNDKLVGFLNSEETKDLLFIRNEVNDGLIIEEMHEKDISTLASLQIFKNKTKVTPVVEGKDITINLNMDTTAAIDEIDGTTNFSDDEGRMKLEQSAENALKERIEALIKRTQSEYDADIFGFGSKLWEDKPQVWNSCGDNWEQIFKGLKVNVKARVHIKNSAILSKPVKEGD
jgi:spore germination protein KC